MTNDPVLSDLHSFINDRAVLHLKEMGLATTHEPVVRHICANCKHCEVRGDTEDDWVCVSPRNGVSLLTGKVEERFCSISRHGRNSCSWEGYYFEPKPELVSVKPVISYKHMYLPTKRLSTPK
jgi:hypothetical protein